MCAHCATCAVCAVHIVSHVRFVRCTLCNMCAHCVTCAFWPVHIVLHVQFVWCTLCYMCSLRGSHVLCVRFYASRVLYHNKLFGTVKIRFPVIAHIRLSLISKRLSGLTD